jgi:hypothetical protein
MAGRALRRTILPVAAAAAGVAAVAATLLGVPAEVRRGAAVVGVAKTNTTIATAEGRRPVHMVTVVPGGGAHLEAIWLGGGPGRAGTVGAFIRRNAGARGAVAGLNGDFFVLSRNVPSGNLFIHRGRSFLGDTTRGTAAFAADGSVDVIPGASSGAVLARRGVREAISGKPVYVDSGRVGNLSLLEPYQRNRAYHRAAVGRLRDGRTALVVIGGAGLSAVHFSRALIRLGFVEALGMDIDSSANVNWRGVSLNRPSYQRRIPTGIIVFSPRR